MNTVNNYLHGIYVNADGDNPMLGVCSYHAYSGYKIFVVEHWKHEYFNHEWGDLDYLYSAAHENINHALNNEYFDHRKLPSIYTIFVFVINCGYTVDCLHRSTHWQLRPFLPNYKEGLYYTVETGFIAHACAHGSIAELYTLIFENALIIQ